MILYINGNFLAEPLTGVQQYAMAMLRQIDRMLLEEGFGGFCEAVLLTPQEAVCPIQLQFVKIKKVGHWRGNLWEQCELPFATGDEWLLNFCNRAPLFKKKQVLVIHDAAISATPGRFSKRFRLFWQSCYRVFAFTLPKIITVSDFSRNELHNYFDIPKEKVDVIHPGVEHLQSKQPDFSILDKFSLVERKFILAVGATANKNLHVVSQALSYLDKALLLVIVGKVEELRSLQVSNKRVVLTGRVTDEELAALYKKAVCLVFPSLYEGFGIPPIEGMSLACPVIVAGRASLPEVCLDAAVYCNPADEKDVAEKIGLILHDDALAEDYRKRGLARAAEFSWAQSARMLSNTLKQLVMSTGHKDF